MCLLLKAVRSNGKITGCFFSSCLTDKCRLEAPLILRRTSRVGEVQQSMVGDAEMIAVIITFIKCNNKKSLEPQAGAYRSSGREKNPLYIYIYIIVISVISSDVTETN